MLFATDTTLGVGKVDPLAVLGVPPLTRLGLTSIACCFSGSRQRPWGLMGGCHVLALCPTCSRSQRVPRSCEACFCFQNSSGARSLVRIYCSNQCLSGEAHWLADTCVKRLAKSSAGFCFVYPSCLWWGWGWGELYRGPQRRGGPRESPKLH